MIHFVIIRKVFHRRLDAIGPPLSKQSSKMRISLLMDRDGLHLHHLSLTHTISRRSPLAAD